MPSASSRSPEVRALTTSVSAQSPCVTTLLAPSSTQPPPLLLRGGHHVGDVVARLPLAVRERELHAAVGDRRQHARLLRIAAAETHRGAAQHHGRQIRLQDQRAAERLHHQHDLDRAAAEPAVLLGERQAEQAEFGVLRPQRGAPAARLLEVVLALIERVAVGHQPIDAVLQQALFVGEGEVHRGVFQSRDSPRHCRASPRQSVAASCRRPMDSRLRAAMTRVGWRS